VLFVPEHKSSDEVEKDRRTEGDERKIDKGQSDIARLDAHLVTKPRTDPKGVSLVKSEHIIKQSLHLSIA
jgi:hypothetical protein